MGAKEHYDNLLGDVYTWMSGDFTESRNNFLALLKEQSVLPDKTKVALDLGAGHGVQTSALIELGFNVIAVDFNRQLLDELRKNNPGENLTVVDGRVETVADFAFDQPELIVCWGDTLAHLESFEAIVEFLQNCFFTLITNGRLVLSFRDYTHELTGSDRFIPVKSDDRRIMTCFLEYTWEKVIVTDIIYEKTGAGWQQKVSSYPKIRLTRDWVLDFLENMGLRIIFNETQNGFVKLIAVKQ